MASLAYHIKSKEIKGVKDYNFNVGVRSPLHRSVVVIATAQLHSTKHEFRFCAGSNSARDVSEIRDGEDL